MRRLDRAGDTRAARERNQLMRLVCAASILLGATPCFPQQTSWRVDPTPKVVIGSEESDAQLLTAGVGATRYPDGQILVGDNGDYALLLYDKSGKFVRKFARKGKGPGEIEFLVRLLACGDSLYTHDAEAGRISVFSRAGKYARSFRFVLSPYTSACSPSATFAHLGWEDRRQMRGGAFRTNVPVWLSTADERMLRMLDSVPGSERWGHVIDGQLRGTRPLPLGREPVIGIGRTRVYVGSADRFTISVYDYSGRRLGPLEKNQANERTTRADIQGDIDAAVRGRGDSIRSRAERSYAEMKLPTTLPPYTQLVVDADDHVWVRSYTRPSETAATWTVFSPTGSIVTEVKVPRQLRIFEIGTDYLLGHFLDPDTEAPQIRLYALHRSRT